jgi:pyruvate/2-oxoglutarate dehydrogenase complex dihydrolipoamide dehydrogenase (E3) component
MGGLLGVADRLELTRELTRHWMPLGKRVVVVGGGLVGVELAEFLCERGRRVTVVEESGCLAAEMAPPRRWRALYTLREHGVDLIENARVICIEESAVEIAEAEAEPRLIAADSVVIATGVKENRSLAKALAGVAEEIHELGDCGGVGYIKGAMLDAARVARQI